jgi:SAM-dependent methyltransferase
MEFTSVEQHVLAAVRSCVRRRTTPTEQALGEHFQDLSQLPELNDFGAQLEEWGQAIVSLVEKGVLIREDEAYALAEQGQAYARRFAKQLASQFYDRWMIRHAQSPTYHTFCQRLYGQDLCQFNMVTKPQLEKLLQELRLTPKDRVLDMGCGIGTVTEYISDVTRATITGLDQAAAAIAHAQERTAGKRERLTFLVGDMDELTFPADSFEAIIALDTLYFVEDLPSTLSRMKEMLAPDGRMGLFWSEVTESNGLEERLRPEKTKLAEALVETGLPFQFWDMTREERELWVGIVALAEELRPAFEAEGNHELYKSIILEGQEMASYVEAGRTSRYLYCCQAAPG